MSEFQKFKWTPEEPLVIVRVAAVESVCRLPQCLGFGTVYVGIWNFGPPVFFDVLGPERCD